MTAKSPAASRRRVELVDFFTVCVVIASIVVGWVALAIDLGTLP